MIPLLVCFSVAFFSGVIWYEVGLNDGRTDGYKEGHVIGTRDALKWCRDMLDEDDSK
jgi:hypothetical protein